MTFTKHHQKNDSRVRIESIFSQEFESEIRFFTKSKEMNRTIKKQIQNICFLYRVLLNSVHQLYYSTGASIVHPWMVEGSFVELLGHSRAKLKRSCNQQFHVRNTDLVRARTSISFELRTRELTGSNPLDASYQNMTSKQP